MPYYLEGENPNTPFGNSPFRTNVVPDAEPKPNDFGKKPDFIEDTLPAAWHEQASYQGMVAVDDMLRGKGSPRNVDPTFNPLEAAKGTHLETAYDKLAGIVNKDQFNQLLSRERQMHDDRRTLAASGLPGVAATMGMGLIDPGPWIAAGAFGGAANLARMGIVGGAAAEGFGMGAYTSAAHAAYNQDYGVADAARNMAQQTLLGAAIGKGIKYLSKDELEHIIESQAVDTGIQHFSEARGKVVGAGPEMRYFSKEEMQAAMDAMPKSPNPEINNLYEAASKGRMTEEEILEYQKYQRDFQKWHVDNEAMVPHLRRIADGEAIDDVVATQPGPSGNYLAPPTEGEFASQTASAADVSAARNPDPYALTAGRDFKQSRGAFGSDWLIRQMSKLHPLGRILNSKSLLGKETILELSETAREFEQAGAGVPTSAFGGAIETEVGRSARVANIKVRDVARDAWLKHLHGDKEAGMMAGAKADFASLMRSLPEGKLSYSDFKAQISRALRSGDKNEAFPEAAEAAQYIRKEIINPLSEELKTLKYADGTPMLDPEATAPKGDESFYSRLWNLPVVRGRRQKLRGIVTNWLKQQQDIKYAAQQRILAHTDNEVELGKSLDSLEGKLATIRGKLGETNVRLKERRLAVRDGAGGANTVQNRLDLVNETIGDMQSALEAARADVRDPDRLQYIDSLEKQIAELRAEASPISDKELAKIEKDEINEYLSPEAKKAAKMVLGQQKYIEPPSFLNWMKQQGGVVDNETGSLVRKFSNIKNSKLQKKLPPKFLKDERTMFGATQHKTLGDWGETFEEMARAEGLPSPFGEGAIKDDDVIQIIYDAAHGDIPEWWTPANNYRAITREAAWLEDAIREAGVEPKSLSELIDVLRTDDGALMRRLEEKAQAAGEQGVLEQAVGNARGQTRELRDFISRQVRARNLKEAEARGLATGKRAMGAINKKNMGRIGVLNKRAEFFEQLEAMTELTIAATTARKNATRAALEKEIENWQGNSAKEAIAALMRRREQEAARAERIAAKEAETGIKQPEPKRMAGADREVNKALKRILNSERQFDYNELGDRADEIIDRIIGNPDGRFPYDIASSKYATPAAANNPARGSLHSRDFAIPSNLVEEFLHNDVEHVMASYLRTVLPDKELVRRFGDVEMTAKLKDVEREFDDMANALTAKYSGAKLEKETTKLMAEKKGVLEDLADMRDRVRNTYGWTGNATESMVKAIATNVRNYVTLTALGSAPINSFTDFGGNAIMRHGMTETFGQQYLPFVKSLIANPELRKLTREQAREFGIGVETALGQSRHSINDLVHNYMPEDRFSYGLGMLSDKFQKINMLGPWTDISKLAAFPMVQGNFIRLSMKVAAGKATKSEIAELANASISPDMASQIAKELETHAGIDMGIKWANAKNWTNTNARRAFENAVAREVNILVVTPGLGEVPLTMSTALGSVIGQFKSYMFGANERIMIANLQRGEMTALRGLLAMTGLGTMSYAASQLIKGEDLSDNPMMILKEGLDRGTVAPVINEVMKDLSKATSGRLDPMAYMGAAGPVSRRAYNSSVADFLGPAYSTGEHLYQLGHGAARELLGGDPMTRSEIHHGRLGFAYQNVWWLRGMLDRVEDGVGDAMDAPGTRRHRGGFE